MRFEHDVVDSFNYIYENSEQHFKQSVCNEFIRITRKNYRTYNQLQDEEFLEQLFSVSTFMKLLKKQEYSDYMYHDGIEYWADFSNKEIIKLLDLEYLKTQSAKKKSFELNDYKNEAYLSIYEHNKKKNMNVNNRTIYGWKFLTNIINFVSVDRTTAYSNRYVGMKEVRNIELDYSKLKSNGIKRKEKEIYNKSNQLTLA